MIIITVVCCAVGTSIVWVVVIYQTRKRLNLTQAASTPNSKTFTGAIPELENNIYSETSSQHSQDSGTCDSTNPSNDRLQLYLSGRYFCLSLLQKIIINFFILYQK